MPDLAADGFALPPVRLIMRAGSTPGADAVAEYLAGGAGMKELLMSILATHSGIDASAAPRILDFGCGAGNVLRHFGPEARRGQVWGCDIDHDSIAWLEQNLSPPFRVFTAGATAALPQSDEYFDLIYAISVFTHIADEWAIWLSELHRVLKTGGVLMATFLGEGMIEAEHGGVWDDERIGMNVLRHGQDWDGGGPTVFLSDWWIRAHWGRAFEVLEIHHDRNTVGAVTPGTHGYAVMRKRKVSVTPELLTELEPAESREVSAMRYNIEQLHDDDRRLREALVAAVTRGNTEHARRVAAEAAMGLAARPMESDVGTLRAVSPSHPVSKVKRLARRVVRPVTSPIDGRVADINRRVGTARHEAERQGTMLRERIDAVEQEVGSYARASAEAASFVGVELRRLEDMVREIGGAALAEYYRRRLAQAHDFELYELDGDLASLLNASMGHRGFAAQADLWFNPPVTVELTAGAAKIGNINERIVELPFAMSVLGRLTPGARILDIGSAESTFPLSAASLGYHVTAVDLKALPYTHPNLTSIAGRFEDWTPEGEQFAAAFLISTIEHVGLGAYGEDRYDSPDPGVGADRALLDRLARLLTSDGLLALTTPYGEQATSDLERTYDAPSLALLFDGWNIVERRTIVQTDLLTWVPGEPVPGQNGVAMVVAQPPQT